MAIGDVVIFDVVGNVDADGVGGIGGMLVIEGGDVVFGTVGSVVILVIIMGNAILTIIIV